MEQLVFTPQEMESLLRWLAEDGEAEDELNQYLAYRDMARAQAGYRGGSCPAPPNMAMPGTIAAPIFGIAMVPTAQFVPPPPAWEPPPPPAWSPPPPQAQGCYDSIDISALEGGPAMAAPAPTPVYTPIPKPPPKKGALHQVNKVVSIFFIILLSLSTALVLLPRVFGMQLKAVLTASMAPTYPVGSVVVVRKAGYEDINVSDVITYVAPGDKVVTHRVVEKDPANQSFVTQGDANNVRDGSVSYKNVVGKVWFGVPVLGYPFLWLDSTRNKIIAVTVIVAVWFILFLLEKAAAPQKGLVPGAQACDIENNKKNDPEKRKEPTHA